MDQTTTKTTFLRFKNADLLCKIEFIGHFHPTLWAFTGHILDKYVPILDKDQHTVQYDFFCDFSICKIDQMTWDTDHKEKVSLQCDFFCDLSNRYLDQKSWATDYKKKVFL